MLNLLDIKEYPYDNSLVEKMLITVFTNWLHEKKSHKRVMLQKHETLTDAAKYAHIQ